MGKTNTKEHNDLEGILETLMELNEKILRLADSMIPPDPDDALEHSPAVLTARIRGVLK